MKEESISGPSKHKHKLLQERRAILERNEAHLRRGEPKANPRQPERFTTLPKVSVDSIEGLLYSGEGNVLVMDGREGNLELVVSEYPGSIVPRTRIV